MKHALVIALVAAFLVTAGALCLLSSVRNDASTAAPEAFAGLLFLVFGAVVTGYGAALVVRSFP